VHIQNLAIATGLPRHIGHDVIAGFVMQSTLVWRRTFGSRILQLAVIVIKARGVAQKLQFLIGPIRRVRVQNALRRIPRFIELVPLAAGQSPF
jgi:hypothetical protein